MQNLFPMFRVSKCPLFWVLVFMWNECVSTWLNHQDSHENADADKQSHLGILSLVVPVGIHRGLRLGLWSWNRVGMENQIEKNMEYEMETLSPFEGVRRNARISFLRLIVQRKDASAH